MAHFKNSTEVTIFGQKLVLKHANQDPDLVKQVVALVAAKVEEAERRVPGAVPHQVALLALMDLAAEYLQAKERVAVHQREVHEKSTQLVKWIEAELK